MDYLKFLECLKQARIKMGYSQVGLSKDMGKSLQYISLIEHNKLSLKMEDYFRLCELLHIHPCALFDLALPQGEHIFIEKKIANLSKRDFRLVKDIVTLMALNPEDV